jgi:hypothetical protein
LWTLNVRGVLSHGISGEAAKNKPFWSRKRTETSAFCSLGLQKIERIDFAWIKLKSRVKLLSRAEIKA